MQQRGNSEGAADLAAPGVWQTHAPAGYIGIVLYDRTRRLVMRLEVLEEEYSPEIVEPLRQWARDHERVRIVG